MLMTDVASTWTTQAMNSPALISERNDTRVRKDPGHNPTTDYVSQGHISSKPVYLRSAERLNTGGESQSRLPAETKSKVKPTLTLSLEQHVAHLVDSLLLGHVSLS